MCSNDNDYDDGAPTNSRKTNSPISSFQDNGCKEDGKKKPPFQILDCLDQY